VYGRIKTILRPAEPPDKIMSLSVRQSPLFRHSTTTNNHY